MNFNLLSIFAVVLLTITSVLQLVGRGWRSIIIALAVQYIGVFILVTNLWPMEMALTKMVAGWMAGAVLGVAASEAWAASSESWQQIEVNRPSGSIFRLLAAGLVGLLVLSTAPQVTSWIGKISYVQSLGGLVLIGMGLLHLGLTSQPLRTATGLLTILSGFEILYASVETSALVAGLLAAVTMALALASAYLMLSPSMEDTE